MSQTAASECRSESARDALRVRRREEKRRERARLAARGLTAVGLPFKTAAAAAAALVRHDIHPAGCPCYDCLGFSKDERGPIVARSMLRQRFDRELATMR